MASSSTPSLYEGQWFKGASLGKCDCGAVVLRFTFPHTRHTRDNVSRNEYVESCEKGHAYITTTSCRDNLRLIKTVCKKLTDSALLQRLPPFCLAPQPQPPPPPCLAEIKRPPLATVVATSATVIVTSDKDTESKDGTPLLQGAELAAYLQTVHPPHVLPADEIHRSNVVAIGSRCYVLGGRRVKSDRVMCYDTLTRAWQTLSGMPRTFMRHALACTGAGDIVVTGGLSDHNLLNCHRDAYIYTPGTDTWRSLPDMPCVVAYHSALVYRDAKSGDEQLLVLGGVENPENYCPMYRSGAVFGFRTLAWRPFDADMLKCHMFHTARVVPGGVVRVTGGQCADKTHGEATECADDQGEEYDFSTRTWALIGTERR